MITIPMCTVIHIKHRQVHGRDLMDVCDTEQQEAISQLTGCRTVTNNHIAALQKLGFNIINLDKQIALQEYL